MHSHVCEHQSACTLVYTYVCVHMKVAHQWRGLSEVSIWKDGVGQTVSNVSSLRSYTSEHYLSEGISICSEFWGTKYDLSRNNHGRLHCFKAILNSKKTKRPVLFSLLIRHTVLCFFSLLKIQPQQNL